MGKTSLVKKLVTHWGGQLQQAAQLSGDTISTDGIGMAMSQWDLFNS